MKISRSVNETTILPNFIFPGCPESAGEPDAAAEPVGADLSAAPDVHAVCDARGGAAAAATAVLSGPTRSSPRE